MSRKSGGTILVVLAGAGAIAYGLGCLVSSMAAKIKAGFDGRGNQ